MRSKIFDYLPKEDREFIEEWIRVQVEKNTQSYSRFDRFLTFVERGATGAKNAVSGTANWAVETISKIGFHILVANVAYFGLTHGVEWYNGKLIETMNENETLTEQIAEIRKTSKDTFFKLVAEKDAALKLLEEKQAELDNTNKRVKSKKADKPKAPAVSKEEAEYRQCVMRRMSIRGRIDHANAWTCAEYRREAGRLIEACPSKDTEFKTCWVGKLNSGLGRDADGVNFGNAYNKYLLSKDAIDCWKRVCQ